MRFARSVGTLVAIAVLLCALAAAAAAAPRVGVRTAGAHGFEGGLVMLSGDRLRVRLAVRGAPPGSRLVVRAVHNGRQVLMRRREVAGNRTVAERLRVQGPGVVGVRVRLTGPDGAPLVRKRPLRVGVVQPTAAPGARGLRVRLLQRRLARMRYAIRVSGRFDDATRRAVIALRKVNRMKRVGVASRAVFSLAIRGRGAFRPRHRGAAHVEGDLTRQVLALVGRGGRVFKVYMTSSGRPGLRTPAGTHAFYRKSAGWNSSGMLDSAYFTRAAGGRPACAIHGYFVVPIWNASHCCLRVPTADARKIFNWVRIGQRIHVYY